MEKHKTHQQGLGKQVPPEKVFVLIYFAQKGMPDSEAMRFYNYYESVGWKNEEGNPIQNWKTLASEWTWRILHGKPG
jgi:hypothetical protein